MSDHFHRYVIPYVATKLIEKDTKPEGEVLLCYLKHALENRNNNTKVDLSGQLVRLRNYFPSPNKVTMKCEYRNIFQLTFSTRYYSAAVIFHGNEFYYFLRLQKIDPSGSSEDPKNLTLAGYLRCTSAILPPQYFLPIRITVSVSQPPYAERKFAPSSVVFEAPNKAIGGILTLAGENWEGILAGNCPIVVNNCMTVIVCVEFLEQDEPYQQVAQTLEY